MSNVYYDKLKSVLNDAINVASNNLESAGYTVISANYSLFDMKCTIAVRGNHKKDFERIADGSPIVTLYETHEDSADPAACTMIWVKSAIAIDELVEFTYKVRKATDYSAETGFTVAIKGISDALGISIRVSSYTDTTIGIAMRIPMDYSICSKILDRLYAMIGPKSNFKFTYYIGCTKYDFSFDNNCKDKMKVIELLGNLPVYKKDENE